MAKLGYDADTDREAYYFRKVGAWIRSAWGPLVVFLMASTPNPLFDLAGLTCGYYGVTLFGFLLPTILGKSFVKAGSQTFLTVFIFFESNLD